MPASSCTHFNSPGTKMCKGGIFLCGFYEAKGSLFLWPPPPPPEFWDLDLYFPELNFTHK